MKKKENYKDMVKLEVGICKQMEIECNKVIQGCLKKDSAHWYANDLLLRQVQWQSFRTHPVESASLAIVPYLVLPSNHSVMLGAEQYIK